MTNKKEKVFILFIFIVFIFFLDILPGTFNVWHYGVRYNNIREANKIPIIPTAWKCKKTSKNYIFCYPNSKEPLHIGKEIETDFFSICSEKDTYSYEDAKKGKQKLSITRYYNSNVKEIGYYTFLGTSQQKKEELDFHSAEIKLSEWKNKDPN